jgi:hypothetical protein
MQNLSKNSSTSLPLAPPLVGNGKNVFELNQFIFTKYGQTFDELKVEFQEKTQENLSL